MEFERRLAILRSDTEANHNNFVIYAADSDVVKLFTSPSSMGPVGSIPTQNGYGKIFPADDDRSSTAIATVLAEHIFFELSPYPILQLPTHASETSSILDGIVKNLARAPLDRSQTATQIFNSEWKVFVGERLSSEKDDINRLSELLFHFGEYDEDRYEEISRRLISIIVVETHRLHHELVRFLKLFSRQRLIPTQGFSKILEGDDTTRNFEEVFRDPHTISDWFFISERVEFWKPLIQKNKSSFRSDTQIETDASALAHLEFFNRKLAPIGGRLILISGDHSMTKTVIDHGSNEMNSSLIHPRSFLIEALEKINNSNTSPRPFRNSLEILLMNYTGINSISVTEMGEIANRNPKKIRALEKRFSEFEGQNWTIYKGVFDEWEDQKTQVVTSKLLSIDGSQDLIISLLSEIRSKSKAEIESKLRRFQEELEADNLQQWNELSLSFSKAGLGILYALRGAKTRSARRPRNPPPVIFDRFSSTQHFVSKLLETNFIEDLDPGLAALIEKIGDDVTGPGMGVRHQNYLTFLAFSVLSAAEGKWYVSRVLAEKSVEQANDIQASNPNDSITGREAYFVLSQAQRISAKSFSDVEISESHLNHAIERFETEVTRGNTGTQDQLTALKAIRFEGERISILLTKAHFAHWKASGEFNIAEFSSISGAIEVLANKIEALEADSAIARQYREILGAYLFVNAMQLLHLSTRRELKLSSSFKTTSRQLWDRFGKRMNKIDGPMFHVTYLMNAYVLLFRANFLNSVEKKSFRETFNTVQIAKNCIMSYDNIRFSDLSKLISS